MTDVEADPRLGWLASYFAARIANSGICLHAEVIPVELVTGEVVAQLCLTCDAQLPPPLP
jgi:hypothetical protein